jgi:hypothetical protein
MAIDKIKLMRALKDSSDSMGRVDAEKSLQKSIKEEICDELELDKKVFAKLARTYHRQNFDQEVETNREFETLYESVVNKKP